jgi:uracil-DNA glycosylase
MIVCLGAGAKHRGEGETLSSANDSGGPIRAAEALRWWVRAGVDAALDETPHDRFAESLVAGQRPQPSAPGATRDPSRASQQSSAGKPPEAAEITARARAEAATDLEALRAAMAGFDGCALKRTATNTVIADGNPAAPVMIIGEAPGADEDRIGRPFVGRAGQLLDRMLAAIGLDRDGVLITNVIYWRPPGNRTPTTDEIAACVPFVLRHVALVRPKVLVLAGGTAARALLPPGPGITRLRGRWFDLAVPGLDRPVPTLPMFHPSFLLRAPERKREAWRDLLALRARLDELLRAEPAAG